MSSEIECGIGILGGMMLGQGAAMLTLVEENVDTTGRRVTSR